MTGLRGGQGRSAGDVADSASWVGWCIVKAPQCYVWPASDEHVQSLLGGIALPPEWRVVLQGHSLVAVAPSHLIAGVIAERLNLWFASSPDAKGGA